MYNQLIRLYLIQWKWITDLQDHKQNSRFGYSALCGSRPPRGVLRVFCVTGPWDERAYIHSCTEISSGTGHGLLTDDCLLLPSGWLIRLLHACYGLLKLSTCDSWLRLDSLIDHWLDHLLYRWLRPGSLTGLLTVPMTQTWIAYCTNDSDWIVRLYIKDRAAVERALSLTWLAIYHQLNLPTIRTPVPLPQTLRHQS